VARGSRQGRLPVEPRSNVAVAIRAAAVRVSTRSFSKIRSRCLPAVFGRAPKRFNAKPGVGAPPGGRAW
jgi:hypothetical protein